MKDKMNVVADLVLFLFFTIIFFLLWHYSFLSITVLGKIFTHTVKLHRRCDNSAQDIKEKKQQQINVLPIYTGCLGFYEEK